MDNNTSVEKEIADEEVEVSTEKKAKKTKKRKKYSKKEKKKHKIINIAILQFLLLAMLGLMYSILDLGLLPTGYLIGIGAVLVVTWGGLLAWVLRARRIGIIPRLISILLIVILSGGSFLIYLSSATLTSFANGTIKTDVVAVAVLVDDPAENIDDAKNYNFGVQYSLDESLTKKAIVKIEEKVEKTIEITELGDLKSQAEGLLNGEIEAVIYNKALQEIVEESIPGFTEKTKIIHEEILITELDASSQGIDVTEEPFTVYISGIDTYGDISTSSRSDVNILATINPKTREVLLITTPRDYLVEFPGVSYGQRDKLTHAGMYGVDVSMNTVGLLYDTPVDFYVRLNFTSLVQIVDSVGGIEVDSPHEFTTVPETGSLYFSEGINEMNGTEALAFTRERKNLPDGDNDRGKNQQLVIEALIKKMASPAMITGATGILSSVSSNLETNMTDEQIQALIKMQIMEGGTWTITSDAATGDGTMAPTFATSMNLSVIVPHQDKVREITNEIRRVKGLEPIDYELIDQLTEQSTTFDENGNIVIDYDYEGGFVYEEPEDDSESEYSY